MAVNNTSHQYFCESVIDTHELRGIRTPGHRYHDLAVDVEVVEAFPSPLVLRSNEEDRRLQDAEAEDAEAEGDGAVKDDSDSDPLGTACRQ